MGSGSTGLGSPEEDFFTVPQNAQQLEAASHRTHRPTEGCYVNVTLSQAFLSLIVTLFAFRVCAQDNNATASAPTDVSGLVAQVQDVELKNFLAGRANAIKLAYIRPHVNSIISERILFDRSLIREGDSFPQIDPVPYQARCHHGVASDNYGKGFDIYSAKLPWIFDAGDHDPNEIASGTQHFRSGPPNSWIGSPTGEKPSLAYVPPGTGANDIYSDNRTADRNRFDTALVALDIAAGKLRWSFQNVHHNLWDMDISSQPTLADVIGDNGIMPAVYVPVDTGNIVVIDRRNTHLIVPEPEILGRSGAAPGENFSPTERLFEQSFRPRARMTAEGMWDGSISDQLAYRIVFHRLRYEGSFTPPSPQGTPVFREEFVMFERTGIAVDPKHQVAIV